MIGEDSPRTDGLNKSQQLLLSLLEQAYPRTVGRGTLMKALKTSDANLRQHVYRMRQKGIKIKMVHTIRYGLDDYNATS